MSVPHPFQFPAPLLGAALLAVVGAAGCADDGNDAPDTGEPDAAVPAPFELELLGGTPAQGSIFWGELTLVDPDASFDAQLASDGIFVTDPVAMAPEGVNVLLLSQVQGVLDPRRLSLNLEADAAAPTGWLPIELRYADGRSLTVPRAIEIAPREPVELEVGVEITGDLDLGTSQLYRLGLDARAIVGISAPTLRGRVGMPMLLGPSGSYDDLRSVLPTSGTMAEAQVYVVAVALAPDEEGADSVRYDLTARVAPLGDASAADAAQAHEGAAQAQPLALPVTVRDAELAYEPAAGFEDDWYRIEIGAADAGRALAAAIDAKVDTYPALWLYGADGTTVVAEIPDDNLDISYHRRTLFSGPLEAGTYYLEVAADIILPDPIPYTLGVALEEVQP